MVETPAGSCVAARAGAERPARAAGASMKALREPLREMQVVVPNAAEGQPQRPAEPGTPPVKKRDAKRQRQKAARQAKKRAANQAAEAAAVRDRQRLWDAAPQLYRFASDIEELGLVESTHEGKRPATVATQPRREVWPAALKMQAAAQVEAADRAYEENAVALAVEISLVEKRNTGNADFRSE